MELPRVVNVGHLDHLLGTNIYFDWIVMELPTVVNVGHLHYLWGTNIYSDSIY